jgi:hypothetical protein
MINNVLLYIGEVGLCLSLFYCLYWLLLKRETFFILNRFYLIGSLLLSLTIPLWKIPSPFRIVTLSYSPLNLGSTSIESKLGWSDYLLWIYLIGAGFCSLFLIIRFIQLVIIIRKQGVQKINGHRFVFTDHDFSEFTFFRLIFINPAKLSGTETDPIMAHERVHICQCHSLDLIFIELMFIFQWFNPFVWLYRRSIKETHEYIADEAVIAQGCNTATYQTLIFERFVGARVFGLASNFNQSQLKRRITMLTKHKSKKWAKWKFLLLLPVLALVILAFAQPKTVIEPAPKQDYVGEKALLETPWVISENTHNLQDQDKKKVKSEKIDHSTAESGIVGELADKQKELKKEYMSLEKKLKWLEKEKSAEGANIKELEKHQADIEMKMKQIKKEALLIQVKQESIKNPEKKKTKLAKYEVDDKIAGLKEKYMQYDKKVKFLEKEKSKEGADIKKLEAKQADLKLTMKKISEEIKLLKGEKTKVADKKKSKKGKEEKSI